MKRFVSLLLTVTLSFLFIIPAHAAEPSSKLVDLSDPASKEILDEFFVEEDLNTFIEDSKELIEENTSDGLLYTGSTISFVPATRAAGSDISVVKVSDHFVQKTPTILNDSSHGMSYWLDVVWNIVIGTKTKHAWKAATVLGVEPSMFDSKWHEGDLLQNTTAKDIDRYFYKMYNSIQNEERAYYQTEESFYTEYVDVYTVDLNGKSFRASGDYRHSYRTEHFNDEDWIHNYVRNACRLNILVCEIDKYE
ncbi:hypothetical protein [Fournierella sp.]|uniref:hypothetical protein n=1 Tax=Allofournierella sp. TaxID=1940256 RepID=UPI00307A04FD